MKRIMFSLVAVLMISAMVVPAALAAPAYSGIQVLNLGTGIASINIYYYNQDGTLATMSGGEPNPKPDTVAVGASNNYFPVHTADGFNGSVVIESTEPIAVISNILYTSTPMQQSSWNGFEAGGSVLRFPLIMKLNNSNDTTFNVQNTTSQPVSIIIHFEPQPGSTFAPITDVTDTIQPWAAHTYDQRTMTQFPNAQWIGSATVTVQGAGAVAGVAQQIDSARQTASAYSAFLDGAPIVKAPLLMKDNNNMWTGVSCQNLGATNTNVTLDYAPASGYPDMTNAVVNNVVPGGIAVIFQFGAPTWIGAGTITNSANNNLACIVNQVNTVNYYASAYEGFDPALTTSTSVAPLIQFQNQAGGALWTGISVQNLAATNATITLDFKPSPGFSDIASPQQTNILPGAVAIFFFHNPYGTNASAIGGAEITSTAGDIAVIVNQMKSAVGDVYSTYDGFAKVTAP